MRDWVFLECTACGDRYYRTSVAQHKQKKLELKKFCSRCKQHTLHKEKKK